RKSSIVTDPTSSAADPLALARDLILRPSGLDDGRLDRVFGEVLTHSVDFADLYFQLARQESWSLEDGIVKDGSASIEQGVGVRALAGEKTGFAYSDEIILPALQEARARPVRSPCREATGASAPGTGRRAIASTCRTTPSPRFPTRTRFHGWNGSTTRPARSIR